MNITHFILIKDLSLMNCTPCKQEIQNSKWSQSFVFESATQHTYCHNK